MRRSLGEGRAERPWRCIVEHEDNEMMRPYRIGPEQSGQPQQADHPVTRWPPNQIGGRDHSGGAAAQLDHSPSNPARIGETLRRQHAHLGDRGR